MLEIASIPSSATLLLLVGCRSNVRGSIEQTVTKEKVTIFCLLSTYLSTDVLGQGGKSFPGVDVTALALHRCRAG